jgi:phospholipid transport system substrate-binding protein
VAPGGWHRRGILLLGALGLVLMLAGGRGATAEPTQAAAEAMVGDVGNEVLLILQDDAASDAAKFDRLMGALEGPIDLDLVGKLILGRHWRTASDTQRAEYLELFRAYALDFLASKLHVYSGQEFAVTSARVVSKRDALVTTNIIASGRPPVQVDWRLRERPDGELVAIDVIVEGVSLIVSQRSEFGSVIERKGFDGLLAQLRQRSQRPA